jgi:flagellar biosynthesis/type III secretory pathway M-ring protein FliF/YscJ
MTGAVSVEIVVAGLVLVALVALVVVRPLVAGGGEEAAPAATDERRAGLEAAKEAKYREIRDAELDFRMGKMSESDYRTTDRELRAQAIGILKRIDELDGEGPEPR